MKGVIGRTLASIGLAALAGGAAHAGVTIKLTDTGTDVVVTAAGTLNMTDLTESIASLLASGPGLSDFGGALGSSQALVLGSPTPGFLLRSGPTFLGSDYPFFGAEQPGQTQLPFSSASGDLISLGYSGSSASVGIGVSSSYVSGDPLVATGTWEGLDLARLGVSAGSTHTWSWGSGPTADFLTIEVAAVPEPSTYVLLLAGLGLVGWAARRTRNPRRRFA